MIGFQLSWVSDHRTTITVTKSHYHLLMSRKADVSMKRSSYAFVIMVNNTTVWSQG